MMPREWQPGDVAIVKNEFGVWNVAICSLAVGARGFVWKFGVADTTLPVDGPDARPLVVIDPEDAEQVERLWRIWTTLAPDRCLAQDCMQAALREFADPKPRICDAVLYIGGERIECERDPGHVTAHRNDSIAQGLRWGA